MMEDGEELFRNGAAAGAHVESLSPSSSMATVVLEDDFVQLGIGRVVGFIFVLVNLSKVPDMIL